MERVIDLKLTENTMRVGNREPNQHCRKPRRYKLALLTFVGLLAPVYFVPPALTEVLTGPRLLTVSVAVAVIVALMTYVIMPVLTFFATSWLYKQPSRKS